MKRIYFTNKSYIKKAIIFLFLIAFLSCKTKERIVQVEVPVIKTEYKDRLQRDSIYLKDSIYIERKGDSIFIAKLKYLYKYLYLRDTIAKIDTIGVPVEVIRTEKVNELTKWQEFKISAFDFLIAVIIGALIYIFRKQIFDMLKWIRLILRI